MAYNGRQRAQELQDPPEDDDDDDHDELRHTKSHSYQLLVVSSLLTSSDHN